MTLAAVAVLIGCGDRQSTLWSDPVGGSDDPGEVRVAVEQRRSEISRFKKAIAELGGSYRETRGRVLLSDTDITDEDLKNIRWISPKEISILILSRTRITDLGLSHIDELDNLDQLSLSDTAITDAGLIHLEPLTGLADLDLARTAITDDGLTHLSALPRLRALDVSGTSVTDEGLNTIMSFSGLRTLDLSATQITDAGVEQLKQGTSLSTLTVSMDRISEEAAQELRAALPSTLVVGD